MNRVIFGGSFNPPHSAHLEMLLAAAGEEFVDNILVLPANVPPHKERGSDFADTEHRVEMCKILASYSQKAEICTEEIERGGKSYMIDTVLALAKKYPADKLWLLIGADMVVTLKNWYRGEELIKMVGVLAIGRNTVDEQSFLAAIEEIKAFGGEVIWLKTETAPISSTIVREKLKNGKKDLPLPKEILEYIRANGLYKG